MNPRLRFKRDDGTDYPDWEEKKLGELGNFTKGANLSRADISETGTPFILYGELYTTYDEVAYEIKRKTEVKVDKKYYSKIGDVVIPTSGETAEEISKATCVMQDGVILAGDLNIFRNNIVDGRIISYIINYQVKQDIAKIAQGKIIVHLQAKNLAKILINYPVDREEQEKIGSFLSDIDEVILTTSQEIKKLEELKKGVMQKIFSQEVRFKKADGTNYPDWEEKKLSEQADFLQGLTYSPDDVSENGTLVLRSSNIQNDFISHEDKVYVNINIPDKLKVKENDVLMCVRNGSKKLVGKTALITKKELGSSWGAFMMIIRPKCNTFFLYQYFKTNFFRMQIFNDLGTATINQITKNNINKCKLFLPCLEEQEKIADCLSAFDEAILLSKKELDKWKLLKKGFLQQMFV